MEGNRGGHGDGSAIGREKRRKGRKKELTANPFLLSNHSLNESRESETLDVEGFTKPANC
jgi:hypothetical protein